MSRSRRCTWFGLPAIVLVLVWLVPAAGTAITPFGSVDVETTQCENLKPGPGINDCTGDAWVTGGLSAPHARYRENDFVPMRSVFTDLEPGATYTVKIQYLAVFNHLHAYDYLGTYNASAWPDQSIVPCDGVGDTAGVDACGHAPDTWPVPEDETSTFPNGSHPPPAAANAHFTAWGAELTGAAYTTPACATCGPIEEPNPPDSVHRQIDVTFRAEGPTAVLAWGAHIASLLDWGAGRTIVSAGRTGSDFHLKLYQIQRHGEEPETVGGELTAKADMAPPAPGLSTRVTPPSPVTTDETVTDTATLTRQGGIRVDGTVEFWVCFNATAPEACTVNGTPIGRRDVVLQSGAGPNGEASITFRADQEIGGEGPGYYCFRAEFRSGTPDYSPASHTNALTSGAEPECFHATEETTGPPMLTVTKLCDPGDPGHFNLLLDGSPFGAATNVPCGHVEGPHPVAGGTHTVSETAGAGPPPTDLGNYTTTFGADCIASGARTGSVTVSAGESKVCVVTNTHIGEPAATMTVHKICDPPGNTGEFEILVGGEPIAILSCGGTTPAPVTLPPGTYTVHEAGVDDTSLADYRSAFSDDCAGGSITLTPGENAHCTITNTFVPPTTTLEVKKACDPPGDTGRFKLTVTASDGSGVKQVTVGCGGTTGVLPVQPGSYSVSEAGANGTNLSHYDVVFGDDCESGSITIAAGEEATCLITNVRRAAPAKAELTVTKLCVPPDDGGRFNLMIDGQTTPNVACGHRFGPIVLSPGQHRVTESAGTGTSMSDYTTSINGRCGADGSITLKAGEQATCTITNVRAGQQTGTVEIEKRCSPASRSDRFQLELDQHLFEGIACGDTTGAVVLGVGDHGVGEVGVMNGNASRFRTSISGGCSASGSFTLSAGQHVTCVVTNTLVTLKPGPKPPAACYVLTVAPRKVTVGRRVRVVARVHLLGRGVEGVRVSAAGPGVSAVRSTGLTGHTHFALRLTRAGILTLTIDRPYGCPEPLPQRVGVLAAIRVPRPIVTG